jgi:two-component system sensor histidine kinase KdpD
VQADSLLSAFAAEASSALQRAELAEDARRAEALERADEFKSLLLSSISHDLRSPLTAIKAAVGNLRDGGVEWRPEDTADFLETIESQTDRLAAIVDDLLQMSRLEGGAVSPQIEAVQVGPLLAEAVAAARGAVAGREVRVEAAPDLWIAADDGLMIQALGNLVENAGRYSMPGGAIRLAAEKAGPNVRISVADAGPGIPEADLPHMFEKFYRGVQAKRTRGTGLGLSIVKATVELNRGTVSVRSSPSGSTFTLVLPAAAEAPER